MDHTGICWDGIGVSPDIHIKNTKADIDDDLDPTLEFAVKVLEAGPPKEQDESASLATVRVSLVEAYLAELEKGGVRHAASAIQQVRNKDQATWFLDVKHCLTVAQSLIQSGQAGKAIPLLEACQEIYPQVSMTYSLLAMAHITNGSPGKAREMSAKAESVEAVYPWESALLRQVKAALASRQSAPR